MTSTIWPTTDGCCGLSWDDDRPTSMTPVPSARCPFEAFHEHDDDGECRLLAPSDIPTDWPVQPECRCEECAGIHAEFIGAFGRWPLMSHDEGQALAARRADNLASWDRARLGTLSGEYDRGTS